MTNGHQNILKELENMAEVFECPACGAHDHEHKVYHEMGKDLASNLFNAIQDLKAKFPNELTYCPVCGAKL